MAKFYSNRGLLESKDRNGEDPELFIVCSRVRGPGKTYSFAKTLMDRFYDDGGKFVLLCRVGAELGSVAEGMMKSMMADHYPGLIMSEKIKMGRTFSEVWVESQASGEDDDDSDGPIKKEHVGYVIPLNGADRIKKVSSTFTDAVHGYFDEFQPEYDSTYLKDEVERFKSVHTSIARGGGSSRRYFPIYMSSNAISIANPYFVGLGLTTKIQSDTKKYRGDGYVYQRAENVELAESHDGSAMSRAFRGLKSSNFTDNSWVNDNGSGVCKSDPAWGRSYYMGTLVTGEAKFGVFHYPEVDMTYISHNVDKTYSGVYRIEIDGEPNLPLLRSNYLAKNIKQSIQFGTMRYQSETAKRVAMECLV